MSFVTIDVVPDPTEARSYVVEIKCGKDVLAYWNVGSEEEGRAQVKAEIRKINKRRNPDISNP